MTTPDYFGSTPNFANSPLPTDYPVVTITGGGGSGATAYATIADGVISKITVTEAGNGYTSPPIVQISGGQGLGATAQAVLTADYVGSIIVKKGGSGYKITGGMRKFVDSLPGIGVANKNNLGQYIPVAIPDTKSYPGCDYYEIVQLINRVGWDGAIVPPDPNEVGWKDTVRMNPLQNAIVAIRPVAPIVPFKTVNSIRALDVTMPLGSTQGFANVDSLGEPAPVTNTLTNFGWEFMWHCHMLGHEENMMMRPMCCAFPPDTPGSLSGVAELYGIQLTWIDNSVNETDWIVERALADSGPWNEIASVPSQTGPDTGAKITYVDNTAESGVTYWYRIKASNTVGYTQVYAPPTVGYPIVTNLSLPSPIISVTAQ